MIDLPESDEQQTVPSAAQHTRVSGAPRPVSDATVPHRAVPPAASGARRPHPPVPLRPATPPRRLPLRFSTPKRRGLMPYLVFGAAALGISSVLATLAFLMIGLSALNSDRILSGVSVAGISVGGLSVEDAADKLARHWGLLTLTDAGTGRQWQAEPSGLGIRADATASARHAYAYGRETGDLIRGLLGTGIAPVLIFDPAAAREGLATLAPQMALPATNAGIRLENGRVLTTPARDGRAVDLDGTVTVMGDDPVAWLTHGEIPLKMVALGPAITDASPMVAAAELLLQSPLTIEAFEPVTGSITEWSADPANWVAWLVAEPDSTAAGGLRLSLDAEAARAFVQQVESQLGEGRYLDHDRLVAEMQRGVALLNTRIDARIYHHDRQRVVQAGETIISIAYQEGVPYPWIQRANGGIEHVTAGQTIVIPSPDTFFKFEPVRNKRIVVSISEQRVIAYENGAVKWDWRASTGMQDSPTWPGIYQIISHHPNAYAGNWNLWMPQFMGVYQPIPDADFTNGFHGFPTRGGGQILWENSIGTRVTYGCILLSNTNARLLYDWAEDGVVVEIRA